MLRQDVDRLKGDAVEYNLIPDRCARAHKELEEAHDVDINNIKCQLRALQRDVKHLEGTLKGRCYRQNCEGTTRVTTRSGEYILDIISTQI